MPGKTMIRNASAVGIGLAMASLALSAAIGPVSRPVFQVMAGLWPGVMLVSGMSTHVGVVGWLIELALVLSNGIIYGVVAACVGWGRGLPGYAAYIVNGVMVTGIIGWLAWVASLR